MHLDTHEVGRIAERLGALGNRHKLLASYIAVQAADTVVCSEMGFKPHELEPAVRELCTTLYMTYLEPPTWRAYVRAAVLHVASPDPAPKKTPQPKVRHKITRKTWEEAEPLIRHFLAEAARTTDPTLATMYRQVQKLFAFALSLCGNLEAAQEYVQETLVRAYTHLGSFDPGSNLTSSMSAWLFTILRNLHDTDRRNRIRRRTISDTGGAFAEHIECLPDQLDWLHLQDARKALELLPAEQREAVLLVAAGASYEEAAARSGCPEGTIKSRVNRGRTRLAELLEWDLDEEPAAEPQASQAA